MRHRVPHVAVDYDVTVTVKKGGLLVTPPEALIKLRGSLNWVVSIPRGETVEIDFVVSQKKKGPFKFPGKSASNPVRGRYTGRDGDVITSNAAEITGYWKYQVVRRDAGGGDIDALDPGLMVKD
jgi:hypothetical protein